MRRLAPPSRDVGRVVLTSANSFEVLLTSTTSVVKEEIFVVTLKDVSLYRGAIVVVISEKIIPEVTFVTLASTSRNSSLEGGFVVVSGSVRATLKEAEKVVASLVSLADG